MSQRDKKMLSWGFVALCACAMGCGEGAEPEAEESCPSGQTRNPISGQCQAGTDGGATSEANNTSSPAEENAQTGDPNQTAANNDEGEPGNQGTGAGNNTSANDTSAGQTGQGSQTGTNNATSAPANNQTTSTGAPTGATLVGTVTRSAMPAAGGVGHIYVGVFDGDPLGDGVSVGQALIEDVDMSAPGATASFRIEGVPPRAEQYSLVAFLDDNGTVDPSDESSQGPDKGDLVSMEGFGTPKVTIDQAGEVMVTVDLNVQMPF